MLQTFALQERPHFLPEVTLSAINQNGVFVVVVYDSAVTSAVFFFSLR
jgi:hypothetical protein